LWFRAYLRDGLRELRSTGKYQYPRVAVQIFEWMLTHPNLAVAPAGGRAAARSAAARTAATRTVTTGTNINLSMADERNSESFIALDPNHPQFMTAASNNISGSGRQKQFQSSDSGATWTRSELPLAPGRAFHSDPALAFASDGTAWGATLGINNLGNSVQVQVYKSTDHGVTWSFVTTVSTGNNNDKELMWIDTQPTSPFKDNIYVAWDVPGSGMRFSRSADKGTTWSAVMTLSTDGAIGAHLTTGPSGEVYVAWPDTDSRELRIRKSTDGGATFGSAKVIATTTDSFEIAIPAMCSRKALIYLSIGVDRSSGPRKGNVYASWTDLTGTGGDPGCAGVAADANSSVFFSASTDGGNAWSAPKAVHTDPPRTDQFNQWLDVDADDGTVHVAFVDSRNDAQRKKTHLYYVATHDGGTTWSDETQVTTAETDETAVGADSGNQYGDYNGLAALHGIAFPSWTDRRTGNPGGKEQIFTASVSNSPGSFTLPICRRQPGLCIDLTEMVPGQFTLQCVRRPCLVIDLLPKNCLVKFACPGCAPGGLCPPFYQIALDGLESAWTVGLVGPRGEPIAHQSVATSTGTILSFRPSAKLFKEKQIGNYALTFRLRPAGKVGTKYTVKTKLDTSDKPIPKPIAPVH
jgi:hypothetical protein